MYATQETIRSVTTVLCAHPFTKKYISGGGVIEEPFLRLERKKHLSGSEIRQWMRDFGLEKVEAHFWGSAHFQKPGKFDPHSINLGTATYVL